MLFEKEMGKGNADNVRANAPNYNKRIKPDQKLYTRKHCQFSMAGLLTCNIFAALPIPVIRDSGHNWQKPFCVTYSCATARDLHTIPY
jgi:hypothetical protein